MPRYISKLGKFYPCKEKVALKNLSGQTITVDGKEIKPNEPYIYEGPNRASLFELYKAGVEYFGDDFTHDSEFLEMVHNRGFKTVKDYLKYYSFDIEEAEKKFDEKAAKISNEEIKERVHSNNILGGGKDFAGSGKDRYGGFGDHGKD